MAYSEPETPLWTVQDVIGGLAAFGLWIALFAGMRLPADRLGWTVDLGLLVSLGEALLIIPVWWFTVRKYRVGWRMLGLRGFHFEALVFGGGLMMVSFAFNLIYSLILDQFDLRMQVDLVPLFTGMKSPWLFLLGGAVIAPVVEELFFRGFIFAGLRGRYSWQWAAVISAALFALLHFTPTALPPIFLLGLVFAWLYQHSGSIWPAILMHMLTNSLALGAAYALANAPAWGIPLTQ